MSILESAGTIGEHFQNAAHTAAAEDRNSNHGPYLQLSANRCVYPPIKFGILAAQDLRRPDTLSRDTGTGAETRPQRGSVFASPGTANVRIALPQGQRRTRRSGHGTGSLRSQRQNLSFVETPGCDLVQRGDDFLQIFVTRSSAL